METYHARAITWHARWGSCLLSNLQVYLTSCSNFQSNLTCLHIAKFCDGHVDCRDNSDEGTFCAPSGACDKLACDHLCSMTYAGPRCFCPDGKEPSRDHPNLCVDQDECQVSTERSG